MLVREGYTFGEALTAALADLKVEWNMSHLLEEPGRPVAGEPRQRSRTPKGKKQLAIKDGNAGGQVNKKPRKMAPDGKHAITNASGRKFCVDFSRGRCNRKKCPGMHRCNKLLANGELCLAQHSSVKCTRE